MKNINTKGLLTEKHLQSENNSLKDIESELVAQAKSGSLEAFEKLIELYEDKIYSLTRNITGNDADAQDATQDTFLAAVEHIENFRGDSAFGTWLQRIAINAALKILQKRKRLNLVSLDEPEKLDESLKPRIELIADWRDNPGQAMRRKEIYNVMKQALESLDPKHSLVFILRDMQGFSIQETAELLKISPENVKVRLLRARLYLREKINDYYRQVPSDQNDKSRQSTGNRKGLREKSKTDNHQNNI
jgi:RNA polymerase sigma-70 factor (ECF subfamily)